MNKKMLTDLSKDHVIIVVTEMNTPYLVFNDYLIGNSSWDRLSAYQDDMQAHDKDGEPIKGTKIDKVYLCKDGSPINNLLSGDYGDDDFVLLWSALEHEFDACFDELEKEDADTEEIFDILVGLAKAIREQK